MGRSSTLLAQGPKIAIVLTPHETYRASVVALQKMLSDKGQSVEVFELPKDAAKLVQPRSPQTPTSAPADPEIKQTLRWVNDSKPAVVVTVGETATTLIAEGTQTIPLVYCLVTNGLDLPVAVKGDPRAALAAGVTLDVRPRDQLAWISKVQPEVRHLGVLRSGHSAKTAEAIRAAGESAGIVVTVLEASREDFVKAVDDLTAKGCDGVAMLADARIYDGITAKHLLLWGARKKKSVWAFSENFVKAGALSGSYADQDAMMKQVVEITAKIAAGTKPATIGMQYPTQVRRAINERTAALIGLSIPRDVLEAANTRFKNE